MATTKTRVIKNSKLRPLTKKQKLETIRPLVTKAAKLLAKASEVDFKIYMDELFKISRRIAEGQLKV